MTFCQKCGQQLDGDRFCTGCGSPVSTTAPQAPAPPAYQVPPPYQRETYTPPPRPAQPNLLVANCMMCLKQTFSTDPEAAVKTAFLSKQPLWAILGSVFILLSALFMRTIVARMLDGLTGFFGGFGGGLAGVPEVSEMLNRLFLNELITAALLLLITAASVKLIFVAFRIESPFTKVLNLVTSAALLPGVFYLAALLLSFVNIFGALVLFALGYIVYPIMVYRTMVKAAAFPTSPFWLYIVFTIVARFLLILISGLYSGDYSLFGDLLGGFF